jgi:hypothetical protein
MERSEESLDPLTAEKIYKPLRSDGNEIRILTLSAGNERPIRCTLEHVFLSNVQSTMRPLTPREMCFR